MKSCIYSIIALSGLSHAALDQAFEAQTSQNPDALRAFNSQVSGTINNINEYGCWCYFSEDFGRGKGQPVGSIDEMCKVLAGGYECAMRDAEDEGTTCVPWEVTYVSAVGGSGLSIAENALLSTLATTALLEPVPLKV